MTIVTKTLELNTLLTSSVLLSASKVGEGVVVQIARTDVANFTPCGCTKTAVSNSVCKNSRSESLGFAGLDLHVTADLHGLR